MTRQTLRETNYGCPADPARESVLRNVLLCGKRSLNRRRYTDKALADAVPMYQKAFINVDHPQNPNVTRPLADRLGMPENVRVASDGIRGDIRYNPFHPLAKAIKWFADNMPNALGASHNATGQGVTEDDGTFVVHKILGVRSVDLVSDPATTRGLFESHGRRAPRNTYEAFSLLESTVGHLKGGSQQALATGFRSACVAVLDDEDLDVAAKIAKLEKLLAAHKDLKDDGAPALDAATEARMYESLSNLRRKARIVEHAAKVLRTPAGFKKALIEGVDSLLKPSPMPLQEAKARLLGLPSPSRDRGMSKNEFKSRLLKGHR